MMGEHSAIVGLGCERWNNTMAIEQFANVLRQAPFRPFTIRKADGRALDVSHPDFVARSKSGRTVVVFGDDDEFSVLDLLLMSELQVHATGGKAA